MSDDNNKLAKPEENGSIARPTEAKTRNRRKQEGLVKRGEEAIAPRTGEESSREIKEQAENRGSNAQQTFQKIVGVQDAIVEGFEQSTENLSLETAERLTEIALGAPARTLSMFQANLEEADLVGAFDPAFFRSLGASLTRRS